MENTSISKLSYLSWVVSLSAAYFVIGKVSLLLSLSPGFATAIWPASGVALAALLYKGYWLWPGVLLGSFLANLTTTYDNSSTASLLQSLLVPGMIGIGAALQALLGCHLINRFAKPSDGLLNTRSILVFYFLAGPASCLVSASWGNTTLLLAQIINTTEFLKGWFTWWVGDVIGAVLITPLCLIFCGQPRELWQQRMMNVAVPLVITLSLSSAFFFYASRLENHIVATEFEQQSKRFREALEKKSLLYQEIMYSLRDVIQQHEPVNQDQFRQLVQRSLLRNPGIHALSWSPVITDANRADFERRIQQATGTDFTITERDRQNKLITARHRPYYVVARFFEPFSKNKRAFGYDIYSHQTRRVAIDQAIISGNPVATSPIQLVSETGDQKGILYFLPVFNQPPVTSPTSLQQVRGFIVGVFRMGNFLQDAFSNLSSRNIHIQLLDAGIQNTNEHPSSTASPLLASYHYDHHGQGRNGPSAQSPALETENLIWQTAIQTGERTWQMKIQASRQFYQQEYPWLNWFYLVIGFLFSALLGIMLMIHSGYAIQLKNRTRTLASEIRYRKQIEQALIRNERFIHKAINTSIAGIYIYNLETGCIEFTNDSYTRITGYSHEDLNHFDTSRFSTLFHPSDRAGVLQHMQDVADCTNDAVFEVEYRFLTKDQRWIWCLAWDSVFNRDDSGKTTLFLGTFIDITERKQAEEAILISEEKYRLAIEANQDGLWDWDVESDTVYYGPGWSCILGDHHIEHTHQTWIDRIHPEDKSAVIQSLNAHLEGQTPSWQTEHRLQKNDGTWAWYSGRGKVIQRNRSGKPLRMIGTLSDISNRKEQEAVIWYKANYDSLTAVPNRNYFCEFLDNKIVGAKRNGSELWLMFLDLDGFKPINDNLGHDQGDLLLSQVAQRIKSGLRQADFVARLGGDEFVIVLTDITQKANVDIVARHLLKVIHRPYTLVNETASISTSIGIAHFPSDAETGEELLKRADQAMYQAKQAGKHRYRFYSHDQEALPNSNAKLRS